jgi:hypothetical protein
MRLFLLPGALAVLSSASVCHAQWAFFVNASDAIRIDGDTVLGTTATIEARFYPLGAAG